MFNLCYLRPRYYSPLFTLQPLDPTRRLHILSQVILSQVRHTCRCASIPASRRCGCHNLPAQAGGQTPHARPYFCARACSATSLSCQEFSPVLYCDCLSVVARVRRIAARPPGCSRPARRLLPAARHPLPVARRSHLPYTARRLHSRHCRHCRQALTLRRTPSAHLACVV